MNYIFFRDSGNLPIGQNVQLTGRQMTAYLKQFPQSERNSQTNPYSYYQDYKNKRT